MHDVCAWLCCFAFVLIQNKSNAFVIHFSIHNNKDVTDIDLKVLSNNLRVFDNYIKLNLFNITLNNSKIYVKYVTYRVVIINVSKLKIDSTKT